MGTAAAQSDTLRLGLAAALAAARTRHPAVLQAAAERRAREADRLAGNAAFLPRVAAELVVLRSDDPVAVFGSRLRQGRFTAADFALEALNDPRPLTDVGTALSLEQPLYQPEALQGRRAGVAAARAAALQESRTGQAVGFETLRSYFAVRLAQERLAVLRQSLEVARRVQEQVQSLRRNGVVTQVDEQLARTRVSELEAGLAEAEAGSVAAGDLLLLALGEPAGRPLLLSDSLGGILDGCDTLGAGTRDDVLALEAALVAGDAGVSRAKGSWIPSAAAFGTLDWHTGRLGVAAGPGHWTAGLLIRWTPFRGLADLGQLRRAEAERDAARARLADQRRRADAEVRWARAQRTASLAGVQAAD
ncbi:MAG TPA: TolC family protein, partial [Gemmatimonadales bacterium]|nr:TolC family protein [Gemmatimonadales bacterium]